VLRAPDGQLAILFDLGFEDERHALGDSRVQSGALRIREKVGRIERRHFLGGLIQHEHHASHGVIVEGDVVGIAGVGSGGIDLRKAAGRVLHRQQEVERLASRITVLGIAAALVDVGQEHQLGSGGIVVDGAKTHAPFAQPA